MVRWLAGALSLCIAFGGIDAAADVESNGTCVESLAQAQGEPGSPALRAPRSDEPPASAAEQAPHFCHCGLHVPAVAASVITSIHPSPQPVPALPVHVFGTWRTPPPVRPPKLG
ncbi:MAG TPA: hypothetical protein VF329_14395 [Gammaproteobacteria bacterium]